MTKGMSQDVINAMLSGKVIKGMTKDEVIITYGPPSPHRTPSLANQTWIYWLRRWPISVNSRVIFRDDKVVQVLK